MSEPVRVVYKDGTQEWWVEDKRHRVDGPAFIGSDGSIIWYCDGKIHRLDGPARIINGGVEQWWFENKIHRLDGPACIWPNGEHEWWVNDHNVSERVAELMAQGILGPDWARWTDEDRIMMRLCFAHV